MKKIPYQQALGKLLYLAIATRPDIMFHVISLSQFANNPGRIHWTLMKEVIKYVKTTRMYGLLYKHSKDELTLEASSDAAAAT